MDQPSRDLLEIIARALAEPPPRTNHLASPLAALLGTPNPVSNTFQQLGAPPRPNGLFGSSGQSANAPHQNFLGDILKGLELPPPPQQPAREAIKVRNVFYSFHFSDVFRVNHVRNSGKIRPADKGRLLTPNDRSLWERVKRTNPANLRRVIDRGLLGTSVTCVLVGTETWSREWVRYEIARSLARGNGLVAVHIDKCECPRTGFSPAGLNPLAQMALGWDLRIYEFVNGGWYPYSKIVQPLARWPRWLRRPYPGFVMPLDTGSASHDWKLDDGFRNLIRWTDAAAKSAGH